MDTKDTPDQLIRAAKLAAQTAKVALDLYVWSNPEKQNKKHAEKALRLTEELKDTLDEIR